VKRILIVCFLFFALGTTQAQKFQDTIPFRNDLGLIIIPLDFNGEVKHFAFDTGAQYTVAYDWAKKVLKPTRKTMTIVSSSGRRSRMRFYKSGTIKIASRKVTGHRILNTPANDIFSCYKIDGILGVDIIQLLNWKIDFKNKYLILYPSTFFPEETKDMHALEFSYYKKTPNVYLRRKQTRFKFLLDTGASGHPNISKKDYNLMGLDKYEQLKVYSGTFDVNGIFTSTAPKVFQFPESTSGQAILQPIVFYNNLKSSKLGNRLWKDQSLFLSLKKQKLFVSEQNINSTYQAYSCTLGFKDGKMLVMKIVEGSDAWKSGLRQGAEVKALDGKQFSNFCDLYQYQSARFAKNQPLTLTLTNGKTLVVSRQAYLE
tara:strand:+ start:12130 stop:13245 length:1116 start_codon:yes stop_codon:yes gene_type:complete